METVATSPPAVPLPHPFLHRLSSRCLNGGLQQIILQMVESLGYGQTQSGMEDVAGLPGESLGRLAEEFQSRVG